jgi:Protein of unknown function (DUF2997)
LFTRLNAIAESKRPSCESDAGQANSLKKRVTQMETLEFIIYPDGRVQEKVTGITGSSCAEVTAAIEAKLGRVLNQETTSEYFAQVLQQSASTTTQNHSEW